MEIKGKIIKILPLQSGEGRNGQWRKQEFVLEFGDQYPKIVCFSLRGNRIDQFPLELNEQVVVYFDLESREYNGRYYTDVKAWKIEKVDVLPDNEKSTTDNSSDVNYPPVGEMPKSDGMPF
jgi:hypothetical protein